MTTVARHYHIGRVLMNSAVLSRIAVTNRLDDAISHARRCVGGCQRVILYPGAGSLDRVEIGGTKPR